MTEVSVMKTHLGRQSHMRSSKIKADSCWHVAQIEDMTQPTVASCSVGH